MHSNRSFARRQARFTSATAGSYVRMSVDSCIDNASEDGDASSISARSTKSSRSFRQWKKAQRRRHKLKKSASLFEFTVTGDSVRDTQPRGYSHGKSRLKRQDMSGATSTLADDITDGGIDRAGRTAGEEFLQQPYYSSSPLTTSESDSDASSTSERSAVLIQNADVKCQEPYNQSTQGNRNKDLLQRRPYPFIRPNHKTPRSGSIDETIAGLNDERLFSEISNHRQQSTLSGNPNRRSRSVEETKAGLNDDRLLKDISNHHQQPRASEIPDLRTSQSSDEDAPESPIEVSQPDVFSSEDGSFTVTVPMNSPSKPSLPSPRTSIEKSPSEEDASGDQGQNEIYKLIEKTNKKRDDWRRQNGCDQQSTGSSAESRPELLKQKAIELDPGMYFLPPLITTAMRNQYFNGTKTDFQNLSACPKEDESSYPEIAPELCIDTEDGLLKPAIRAVPESDTCSMATECSGVEDIETACIQDESNALESEVQVGEVPRVTESTDTINSIPDETLLECLAPANEDYYSVERPLLEDVGIEHSHEVGKSSPSCDQNSRMKVKVQESHEEEVNPPWVPNGVFTHKAAKDEKCPVCNRKNGGKASTIKDVDSTREIDEKITEESAPHRQVYSHKVGEDENCPECSSKYNRPNGDVLTGLCCVIV